MTEVLSRSFHTDRGTTTVTARRVRQPATVPVATVGFVHGLGAAATVWDELTVMLPDDVEVWVFGLPWDATQGSAWALTREPRVWLERALGLMPAAPRVLVAHSFGANVLLDHVVVHGVGALDGLALLSPFYRPHPDAFTWSVISQYFNDFTGLISAGIRARGGASVPPDVLAAMAERVRDRIGPYGWLRFFELFSATPDLDLSGVTVPCLVVGGDRDTASYPADGRGLARALPSATVEILKRSGHFAMVDEPGRVAALLCDFLRGRRDD